MPRDKKQHSGGKKQQSGGKNPTAHPSCPEEADVRDEAALRAVAGREAAVVELGAAVDLTRELIVEGDLLLKGAGRRLHGGLRVKQKLTLEGMLLTSSSSSKPCVLLESGSLLTARETVFECPIAALAGSSLTMEAGARGDVVASPGSTVRYNAGSQGAITVKQSRVWPFILATALATSIVCCLLKKQKRRRRSKHRKEQDHRKEPPPPEMPKRRSSITQLDVLGAAPTMPRVRSMNSMVARPPSLRSPSLRRVFDEIPGPYSPKMMNIDGESDDEVEGKKSFKAELRAARAEIAAQEKLALQQAHEMRNKYTPAIGLLRSIYHEVGSLERFVEEGNSPMGNPFEELIKMRPEMMIALELLVESDRLHQSRLDCFKIMLGNYVSVLETFSLRELITSRATRERAIASAFASLEAATNSKNPLPRKNIAEEVKYVVDLGGMGDYIVRADHYVLNHVLSNLMSNARKRTTRGEIRVRFLDKKQNGLLRFAVRDTGTGMTAAMAGKLFTAEVTTGDSRGTGLGLPSCKLFCEAVGGSCMVAATQLEDSGGVGGFSEFVFAVSGSIEAVVEEQSPPTTPLEDLMSPLMTPAAGLTCNAAVTVVIVDDTASVRKLLIRAIGAFDGVAWAFEEYATAEQAQPRLLELRHDVRCMVTVDHNMACQGGVLKGTDLIKWLGHLGWKGAIVSVTGDPEESASHVAAGAECAWGKPIYKDAVHAKLAQFTQDRWLVKLGVVPGAALGNPFGGGPVGAPGFFVPSEQIVRLPSAVRVIVVDDTPSIRKLLKRAISNFDANKTRWLFEEFATVEAAVPRMRELVDEPNTLVTVDHNLESAGGVLKGTEFIAWLVEAQYRGVIVSVTGDPEESANHVKFGAHSAWGKPIHRDLVHSELSRFALTTWVVQETSSSPPQPPPSRSSAQIIQQAALGVTAAAASRPLSF